MDSNYVLIADDGLLQRITIRKLLKERKFEVKEVSSGHELISEITKEQPGVVFLDSTLAKIKTESGMQPLDIIKQDPTLENIPFIIMVEEGANINKTYFEDLGVTVFLDKPIDETQLDLELQRIDKFSAGGAKDAFQLHVVAGSRSGNIGDVKNKRIGSSALKTNNTEVEDIIKKLVNDEINTFSEKMQKDLKGYARNNEFPENWKKKLKSLFQTLISQNQKQLQKELEMMIWKRIILFHGVLLVSSLFVFTLVKVL